MQFPRGDLAMAVEAALEPKDMRYPGGGAKWRICASNAAPKAQKYANVLGKLCLEKGSVQALVRIFSRGEINSNSNTVDLICQITRGCIDAGCVTLAQEAAALIQGEVGREIMAVVKREAPHAPRLQPQPQTGMVNAASSISPGGAGRQPHGPQPAQKPKKP